MYIPFKSVTNQVIVLKPKKQSDFGKSLCFKTVATKQLHTEVIKNTEIENPGMIRSKINKVTSTNTK